MNKSATAFLQLLRHRFLRQCLLLYLPILLLLVVFTVTTRPAGLNEVLINATPLVHSTQNDGDAQELRQRRIKTYCR